MDTIECKSIYLTFNMLENNNLNITDDIVEEKNIENNNNLNTTEKKVVDKNENLVSFNDFNLPELLLKRLDEIQYKQPTPIQQKTIPLALAGKDILGSAQTGTGKTAAFMIPIIATMFNNSKGKALILTPTRELAKQILDFTHQLIPRETRLNTVLLIGGNPIEKQFYQLKKQPRIIIGTPGRINDHLERHSLSLEDIQFLVLDETDCMLDMGFGQQLAKIKDYLPETRQTLMFSATIPSNIVKVASSYLKNPERIAIGSTQSPGINIKQSAIYVKPIEKYTKLLEELNQREGSKIIFVKTKIGTEKLYEKIREEKNYRLDFIHGGLTQSRRDRIIKKFKNGYISILIATDVAARGLDIPHIEHVINYDLPQCPEDYIHRIGRTGRAGKNGEAICFVTPSENMQWKNINFFLQRKKMETEGGRGFAKGYQKKNYNHSSKSYRSKNAQSTRSDNNNVREKKFNRKNYNR